MAQRNSLCYIFYPSNYLCLMDLFGSVSSQEVTISFRLLLLSYSSHTWRIFPHLVLSHVLSRRRVPLSFQLSRDSNHFPQLREGIGLAPLCSYILCDRSLHHAALRLYFLPWIRSHQQPRVAYPMRRGSLRTDIRVPYLRSLSAERQPSPLLWLPDPCLALPLPPTPHLQWHQSRRILCRPPRWPTHGIRLRVRSAQLYQPAAHMDYLPRGDEAHELFLQDPQHYQDSRGPTWTDRTVSLVLHQTPLRRHCLRCIHRTNDW